MIRYFNLLIIITLPSLIFPFIQGLINEVTFSKRNIPGRIEIRAIMVNCQPEMFSKSGAASSKHCNEDGRVPSELSEFHGYDKDEITMHSLVKDCKRKLVITMRLKNDKKTVTEEQFVVVDHVYDPVFKKRSRLLNPFVFKIKQNQVLQLYGLQFQNIVNAEVTEEVINKNNDNFTGCDASSSHPTCGFSLSKDRELIPFSEGFCCSCDAYVNSQRQAHTPSGSLRRIIGPSPTHVKSPKIIRNNRDTLDHDDSETKSNSNQKTIVENNSKPDQMLPIEIQDEKNIHASKQLSLTNDHSTIAFQGPGDLELGLISKSNSQVQLDGDNFINSEESIESIFKQGIHEGNNINSEPRNNVLHLLDENENSIASTSSYLKNYFGNICNHFENFEKSSKQEIDKIYNACDFSNKNGGQSKHQINLAHNRNDTIGFPRISANLLAGNNRYKKEVVDSNKNSTFQKQQQSRNTDSFENERKFTRRLLFENLQETGLSTPTSGMNIPLNLLKENTIVSFDHDYDDEKNTKALSLIKKSAKNNARTEATNSIFNSHDDLKPLSISKIDEKILNSKLVRTKAANNVDVISILEHPSHMEPAIGFKKSDRKMSQLNPWNIHTTECSRTRYCLNTSTPHNKYLHYLKFGEDSESEDVGELEHSITNIKEVVRCDRRTDKLATGTQSSEGANSDKASLQKRNTSKRIGAKFNKGSQKATSEIQNGRKKFNVKRQATPHGNQIRGGQSCIDRSTPPGVDPIAYHESAHCLRFSELWYTVYHLKQPFVEHSLRLRLFEKYDNHDKNSHWDEITARIQTNLGTFNRIVKDENPTFSFIYMPTSEKAMGPFQLDTDKTTLLVPQPVSEQLQHKYPQAKAGPSEYLLLKGDQITVDGDECDKVGVSFSAFAKQPDRCSRVRGSCLRNQPLHLWQHDHEALAKDKPGKYFLKNFASISTNPFIVNRSNSDEFLAIEHHSPYSATIEIEVKSDFNGIIRPGIGAQIPEVYVDATCDSNTKIIVTIANMGLASSRFSPRLANCPDGLPEVWLTTQSPAVMIAPQHQHRFHLSLFGVLPIGRFHCSIEVLNDEHDLVATRRIRIQRYDRCFCLYHCLCACIASSKGLNCDQMSIDHFHAAGFLGSLPVETVANLNSNIVKNLNTWSYLVIAFVIVPLFLGLLKALLGACCSSLSSAGMSMITSGKQNKEDQETGKPTNEDVQERSLSMEFFLNIFIFVFLIFFVISKLFKTLCSICCCCFTRSNRRDSSDKRKSILIIDKTEHPNYDGDHHVRFGAKDEADHFDEDGDDDDDDKNEEDRDVLRIVGGEDLDDEEDSQSDILDYLNKTEALEEDQVKKLMKKFKQYYLTNPPDKKEKGEFSEEAGDEEVLSEYETKMAQTFIDLLLESEEVYRHFSQPEGDIIMPEGFEYCIRGFLVKSDTGYFFIPPSPLLQYWTHDKQLMEPPQPLAFADFEKAYDSAIDVLISYDLDLMPNGPAVNVYHL